MNHLITSIMTKNDFPQYSDGDVLIVLNPELQFQLHSLTLRTNSTFFREVLTDESGVVLAPKAKKNGVRIRWRVELQLPSADGDDDGEGGEAGKLKLRELDPQGRPRHRDSFASLSLSAGMATPLVYTHYSNLLRCYYHQPPKFGAGSSSNSFALTLRDVVGLTDIAESLGSIPCVSASLDVALLNQGEMLYRSIASNAPVWADLALRVRSEIMFRESMIHLVGAWNTISSPETPENVELLATMKKDVRELAEAKAKDLDEHKKAVELRILGHYPAQLQVLLPQLQNVGAGSRTIRGAVNAAPTRQSAYSNRVMDWMALNLFRHWLGQSIAGEMSRRAADGGLAFYTAIAQGKETYLDQSARESFCRHFPLSAKARTQFDRAVWEIKEAVKGYVEQLTVSRCQLDTGKWPVEWLTCVEIRAEEMPWVEVEKMEKETENIFGVGGEGMMTREERIEEEMGKEAKRRAKERMHGAGGEVEERDEDEGAGGGLGMIRRQQRYQERKSRRLQGSSPMREVDFTGRTASSTPGRGTSTSAATDVVDTVEDMDEEDAASEYSDSIDSKFGGNGFAFGGSKRKLDDKTKPAVPSNLGLFGDGRDDEDEDAGPDSAVDLGVKRQRFGLDENLDDAKYAAEGQMDLDDGGQDGQE